jgi:transposase
MVIQILSGVTQEAESQLQGDWLVEQRHWAVLKVLDGSPITEVARRYGVPRQSVYTWKAEYAAGGFEGLQEASRGPRTGPTKLPAEVEALICEMRRSHSRWGARRIAYEIERTGSEAGPSRARVHQVLTRNGLVRPQANRWRRDGGAPASARRPDSRGADRHHLRRGHPLSRQYEGDDISLHARQDQHPVTQWKAQIHAPKI